MTADTETLTTLAAVWSEKRSKKQNDGWEMR
jgi:hypothetical protein